jgi:SAM-dependent methyltransferase
MRHHDEVTAGRGILTEWLAAKITRRRLDAFVTEQTTDELTLDIGCGPAPYVELFPYRIGIDIVQRGGADVVGDVLALPVRTGSSPVVFASELLEHVTDPQRAVDEMRRVLAPGGRVILTTRFCFPIHDAPGDYFRFTRYGLEHLFREWGDVEIQAETHAGETLGALLQRVAFQSDLRGGRLAAGVLLLIARLFAALDLVVKGQFGDVGRTHPAPEILTAGYHVVARP